MPGYNDYLPYLFVSSFVQLHLLAVAGGRQRLLNSSDAWRDVRRQPREYLGYQSKTKNTLLLKFYP